MFVIILIVIMSGCESRQNMLIRKAGEAESVAESISYRKRLIKERPYISEEQADKLVTDYSIEHFGEERNVEASFAEQARLEEERKVQERLKTRHSSLLTERKHLAFEIERIKFPNSTDSDFVDILRKHYGYAVRTNPSLKQLKSELNDNTKLLKQEFSVSDEVLQQTVDSGKTMLEEIQQRVKEEREKVKAAEQFLNLTGINNSPVFQRMAEESPLGYYLSVCNNPLSYVDDIGNSRLNSLYETERLFVYHYRRMHHSKDMSAYAYHDSAGDFLAELLRQKFNVAESRIEELLFIAVP